MSLPRIVGVTGYARHGKDTVASVLVRELGYNRVALADQMKQLLLVLDPYVPWNSMETEFERLSSMVEDQGWDGAKKTSEVRRLLQVFGTEVGRDGIGEDVWIEALAKATPGFYGSERKIVIPDVRFWNEARFIRRLRGEVWKVIRPDFDNDVGTSHASEREIGGIIPDDHALFTNSGTKAQLKEKVFRYAKHRLALVEAQ